MQDNDAFDTLHWLLESGADEAMGDDPMNRLKAAVEPVPTPMAAKTISPALARTPTRGPAPEMPIADMIGQAMALAGAATSLAELKAALESFDGCALKKNATTTVFADGTPKGRILFIGEAPGRDEDRAGKPFVGRAGQFLDKMLAAIGLDRAQNVYITNILNWRPPENRDPTPEEAALCLPFLRRHIELVDPLVIVLLGAVAAKHVMGVSEGILKSRGRWQEYCLGKRMVPVMPTLHPAYLLRQPAHKKLAWRDMQAVAAKLEAQRKLV